MKNQNINKSSLILLPSYKRKITAAIAAAIFMLLAGPAFAFSDVFLTSGTVAAYDFGTVHREYIGVQPAFVMIEGFTMKPGETSGWHYHKGQSYVIITTGSLTEQDVDENGHCSSQQHSAGGAFVEAPGQVHTVTNTGRGVVIVWWATIFPQRDGLQSFGTYYVDPPSCN